MPRTKLGLRNPEGGADADADALVELLVAVLVRFLATLRDAAAISLWLAIDIIVIIFSCYLGIELLVHKADVHWSNAPLLLPKIASGGVVRQRDKKGF